MCNFILANSNAELCFYLYVCCSAGTKHKTILEARSGLGPIKAYPRLGPKPSGEQGGGPVDPNTQERTFHCEICNVRVNSELQLKQVRMQRWCKHYKIREHFDFFKAEEQFRSEDSNIKF